LSDESKYWSNFDFFYDPSGDKYSIDFDTSIDLSLWLSSLEDAMKIISTDDSSFELVSSFVSYIVPLKQKTSIQNLSFSVRNLPSVIFKNNELNPCLVGETLVHESDHQLFYAIEKFNNFWREDSLEQEPIYYSPWRDDPRPIDGILRGLSSFTRVSSYYSSAIKTYNFTDKQIDQVGLVFLKRLRESEVALNIVLKSNQLSLFGQHYLDEIQEKLILANLTAKTFRQYIRWNKFAIKEIQKHKDKWKLINPKNEL
jgi:HEXXH motif-containing protein